MGTDNTKQNCNRSSNRFLREKRKRNKSLIVISQVRLYLEVYLPTELVGLAGNVETSTFQMTSKSIVKQKFNFPKMTKPNENAIFKWKSL